MIGRHVLTTLSAVALGACANLNPLAATEITNGFSDRVLEVNNAYRAERNAQILINILRARDRQDTKYTALSELKLAPQSQDSTTYSAGEIGLGNNFADPWAKLGGERSLSNSSNLELTVSPNARDKDSMSVYRSPISPEQFQYFVNEGWSRDLLEKVMINSTKPLLLRDQGGANGAIIDRLLTPGLTPFRVFTSPGELHHCFNLRECAVKPPPPPPKEDEETKVKGKQVDKNKAKKAEAATDDEDKGQAVDKLEFDVKESLEGLSVPLAKRVEKPLNPLIATESRYLYCRQEAVGATANPSGRKSQYDVYRCSMQPLSSVVCAKMNKDGECVEPKSLPLSLFYVVRSGIYTIALNSIDDAIFSLGESLRGYPVEDPDQSAKCPPGMATCTNVGIAFSSREADWLRANANGDLTDKQKASPPSEEARKLLPLFSIATSESLGDRKACASQFAASVTYSDGKRYYAGAPQYFRPELRNEPNTGCYFDDRSGTVISLIAQLIELIQVPVKLTPTTFLFRD